MVGQTFVFLSLSAEAFAASWPYCHVEFLVDAAPSVACVEHGEFLAAANQRGVGHAGEAAAVGEHVQRVKEVALSHAVVAQETVYSVGELQRCSGDILEVSGCQRAQNHWRLKNSLKNRRW